MMSRSRSSFASHRSQEDKAEITRLNLRNIVQGSVERTLAWLGRCRRLGKDWEKTIESSSAWALVTSIRLLSRRLARYVITHPLIDAKISIKSATSWNSGFL